MSSLDAMIIPYLGLANGEYTYTFKVGEVFFKHFEKSKIKAGNFDVDIQLEKRDRMVVLLLTAEGASRAACDRCLTDIDVPISFEDRIILKIEEAPEIQEDEVYYLDIQTSHIDLSTYIYESIHVHMPLTNLRDCKSEEYIHCDHAALDALDQDPSPDSPTQEDNPWGALKDLDLDN